MNHEERNTQQTSGDTADTLPTDERFAVHLSDDMELRNMLRSGLVEAQGRETDKVPMLISWPPWLQDGIVCMYMNDFRDLLRQLIDRAGDEILTAFDDLEADEENDGFSPPAS